MSDNMNRVKSEQLGMSFSTANQRLRKSIMFMLIEKAGLNKCHRCGGKMVLDNFSIEHIEDWLHSENPVELFFDLENITFSHHRCNIANARKPERLRKGAKELKRFIGKSGYIGVYYYENKKKPYRARIRVNGKAVSLGYYDTPEESAKAVDRALIGRYGENVVTNKSLGLI